MDILTQHPHWPQVLSIVQKLKSQGYQAWLAGGCVRDALLQQLPHDFDIATNARPEVVAKLFPQANAVGKHFGVMLVAEQGVQFEIATFRKDGVYQDGRRPQDVVFCTAEEDAQRRDFTVNALFYDPDALQLYDFVDGVKDLHAKTLRAVGDPGQRFAEDKLRILRALRFSAQLGFALHPDTAHAMQQLAGSVTVVSVERVRQELLKLVLSPHVELGLYWFFQLGIFKSLIALPLDATSWVPISRAKWMLHQLAQMSQFSLPVKEAGAWTILLADVINSQEHVLATVESFKPPRQVLEYMRGMLMVSSNWSELSQQRFGLIAREFAKPYGEFLFWWLVKRSQLGLLTYDFAALGQRLTVALGWHWQMPASLLQGKDLLPLGFSPGPMLGEILNEVQLLQLEGTLKDSAQALAFARSRCHK